MQKIKDESKIRYCPKWKIFKKQNKKKTIDKKKKLTEPTASSRGCVARDRRKKGRKERRGKEGIEGGSYADASMGRTDH